MRQQLHLELDLDPREPVAGSVRTSDGRERSFTGWLDLFAALETACAAARAEQTAEQDRRLDA